MAARKYTFNLYRELLRVRIVSQWIGAILMVPVVILGTLLNFGVLVPISWANWLLTLLFIAFVPLVISVACTLTFKQLTKSNMKKMRQQGQVQQ